MNIFYKTEFDVLPAISTAASIPVASVIAATSAAATTYKGEKGKNALEHLLLTCLNRYSWHLHKKFHRKTQNCHNPHHKVDLHRHCNRHCCYLQISEARYDLPIQST